jgi:AcrR family transcriptional regulator
MIQQEEIRSTIIQAARDIFSKYGFKKTTMDDIARGVRKGKSSIYYYFKSKEEVFEAVVETEISLLRNEIMIMLDKTTDPQKKLVQYVKIRMKGFGELINFYNAFKDEYLEQLTFIEKIRKKYDNEEIGIISDILREGMDKSVFCVDNPDMSAMAIVMAMKGMEFPLTIQLSPKALDKSIEELMNLLFYGIVKR